MILVSFVAGVLIIILIFNMNFDNGKLYFGGTDGACVNDPQ